MFLEYQVALQNFATEIVRRFNEAREDERGQTFVEWLGVMAVIVVVAGVVISQSSTLGNGITGVITKALNTIKDAISI
jgi:Flp pilus assembly pilin Flp